MLNVIVSSKLKILPLNSKESIRELYWNPTQWSHLRNIYLKRQIKILHNYSTFKKNVPSTSQPPAKQLIPTTQGYITWIHNASKYNYILYICMHAGTSHITNEADNFSSKQKNPLFVSTHNWLNSKNVIRRNSRNWFEQVL